MLVTIPLDGEEGVYKRLRESEDYKGNFGVNYYTHMSKMNHVVETAKMYIVDNFEKIEDWTEVHFHLYGYTGKTTQYFTIKDAERLRRYPPKPKPETESTSIKRRVRRAERFPELEEMLKRHDEENIQVEKLEAFYDWTDGDFSIQVNDKEYMWIDHRNPEAVIEIAHFIEKTLNPIKDDTESDRQI